MFVLYFSLYTVKKKLMIFPFPAGMSLTKPSLEGNNGWRRENGKHFFTMYSVRFQIPKYGVYKLYSCPTKHKKYNFLAIFILFLFKSCLPALFFLCCYEDLL